MCSPEEVKAISNSRGFPTSPSCSLEIQRQLHSLCHRRRGGGLLESSHPLWLQALSQKVLLPSPCPARASKWHLPVFFHACYWNILCVWKCLLRGTWLEINHWLLVHPQGREGRCIFRILPNVSSSGFSRLFTATDQKQYRCWQVSMLYKFIQPQVVRLPLGNWIS